MSAFGQHSDQQLFVLIQNGDARAYTEVYERYSAILIAHAFRMLSNEEEAGDVVQEVFLALWHKRESLNVHLNLSGYLYASVRNRILNHISRQQVITRYTDSLVQYAGTGRPLPEDLLIEKELTMLIEREIAALPAKMQAIFLLRKKEELSYQEIAERLGITEAAAKQQTYNAVKLLKLKINSLLSVMLFF